MPLVYADTSALFSYFHPRDEFALAVTEAARKESPDFVYWSFMRYELRHNIRQSRMDSYGEVAWKALRAAEKTQARLRWQPELKCDSLLDAADEFSSHHARENAAGSADFLHVAAARRLAPLITLSEFWTCDAEQAKLARTAGLRVRHFESKHPGGRLLGL
jgi:predicted nucleic acid-binding protein